MHWSLGMKTDVMGVSLGAKDDETPASGQSGSILCTVCLGCCTQIPGRI